MPFPCDQPVRACTLAKSIRNENPRRISGANMGIANNAIMTDRPGKRCSRTSPMPAKLPSNAAMVDDNNARTSDR